MTILLSGGSKSGKSLFAQELTLRLANGSRRYYVATMIPADDEDRTRIRRHLAEREGMGFETIECGRELLACLQTADRNAAFLLDSTTALLMNALFPNPASCDMDENAAARCTDELVVFSRSVRHAVIVSDYLYADAARYNGSTEIFRKALAHIDRKLAAVCDVVIEAAAGNFMLRKGELPR
ncbi:MAG: bifunctional adenosylcobinamide kinase/adenosylcobinamide-phosphate guanylyltransferase [Faecousia sp.]